MVVSFLLGFLDHKAREYFPNLVQDDILKGLFFPLFKRISYWSFSQLGLTKENPSIFPHSSNPFTTLEEVSCGFFCHMAHHTDQWSYHPVLPQVFPCQDLSLQQKLEEEGDFWLVPLTP